MDEPRFGRLTPQEAQCALLLALEKRLSVAETRKRLGISWPVARRILVKLEQEGFAVSLKEHPVTPNATGDVWVPSGIFRNILIGH